MERSRLCDQNGDGELMATYSTAKGFTIQSLASDPKTSVAEAGVWATGGAIPATKYAQGSAGTQTSNLVFGGATTPPANGNQVNTTFSYDGSSWTAGGAMGTTRFAMGSFGASKTAAVAAGGGASPGSATTTAAESYDGSSWTALPSLNTGRGEGLGGAGIQAAGIVFGGYNRPGGNNSTKTELWNGSSWSQVGTLNTARQGPGGCGTSTAAIAMGGDTPPQTDAAETYNGTAWTNVSPVNTARVWGGSSGTSTLALWYGGYSPSPNYHANTEYWDGSTWAEGTDLSTGRNLLGGSPGGTALSALASGGTTGSGTGATEEWTLDTSAPITLAQEGQVWYNTASTVLKGYGAQGTLSWSTGGGLNTARDKLDGAGSGKSSGLAFGGATSTPTAVNLTEAYNGTSWAVENVVSQARFGGAGFGTQTAALYVTGQGYPAATVYRDTEIFNGTAWTAGNDIGVGRSYLAGCGTTSGGLAIGGYISSPLQRLDIVEEYNGSTWSETGDLATPGINSLAAAVQGTTTAALAFSGYPGPSNRTEEFDGSSWSETANLNTARANGGGSGIQTAALAIGGEPPSQLASVESYNGSTWTETGYDMGAGRYWGAACGSATNALIFGGWNGSAVQSATEELGAAQAIKTFTAS